MLFVADLIHMNIACRYVLVSALQSGVLIATVRPFAEMLHFFDQMMTERLADQWKVVYVRTRLSYQTELFLVQRLTIVRMYVSAFPVEFVCMNFVEIVVQMIGRIRFTIHQMTEVDQITNVHEDAILSHPFAECHISVLFVRMRFEELLFDVHRILNLVVERICH